VDTAREWPSTGRLKAERVSNETRGREERERTRMVPVAHVGRAAPRVANTAPPCSAALGAADLAPLARLVPGAQLVKAQRRTRRCMHSYGHTHTILPGLRLALSCRQLDGFVVWQLKQRQRKYYVSLDAASSVCCTGGRVARSRAGGVVQQAVELRLVVHVVRCCGWWCGMLWRASSSVTAGSPPGSSAEITGWSRGHAAGRVRRTTRRGGRSRRARPRRACGGDGPWSL
jgi:hypothetical protein